MGIKEVLMRRDGMSSEDAESLIEDAKEVLKNYLEKDDFDSAFYVCEEMFGLEPDYIDELI